MELQRRKEMGKIARRIPNDQTSFAASAFRLPEISEIESLCTQWSNLQRYLGLGLGLGGKKNYNRLLKMIHDYDKDHDVSQEGEFPSLVELCLETLRRDWCGMTPDMLQLDSIMRDRILDYMQSHPPFDAHREETEPSRFLSDDFDDQPSATEDYKTHDFNATEEDAKLSLDAEVVLPSFSDEEIGIIFLGLEGLASLKQVLRNYPSCRLKRVINPQLRDQFERQWQSFKLQYGEYSDLATPRYFLLPL